MPPRQVVAGRRKAVVYFRGHERRTIHVEGGVRRIEKEARGLKPWPQDVLRHTGISCHYRKYEDEAKTATLSFPRKGGQGAENLRKEIRHVDERETETNAP